ncbi:MAG: ATP-binding protein [Phycisphaerales bacterium]|nr:ATP-binding protein [Phycisphaerales bacterium]
MDSSRIDHAQERSEFELLQVLLSRLDPAGPLNTLLEEACAALIDTKVVSTAIVHPLPHIRLALEKPTSNGDRREWPGPGIGFEPSKAPEILAVGHLRRKLEEAFDEQSKSPRTNGTSSTIDGCTAIAVDLKGVGVLILCGSGSLAEIRRIGVDAGMAIGPAAHAAINGELLADMQHQLGMHRSMERRIAESLASVTDVKTLGIVVNDLAEQLFTVEYSALYFLDPDTLRLKLSYAKGLEDWELQDAENTAWDRHPGLVIRTGEVVHVHDTENDPYRRTRTSRRRARIRSRCYLPVRVGEKVVGTLGLASTGVAAFDDEHVAGMQFLTDLAGLTWSRLREETARQRREDLVQAGGACADLLVRTRSWRAAVGAVLDLVRNAFGARSVQLVALEEGEVARSSGVEPTFTMTDAVRASLLADQVHGADPNTSASPSNIVTPVPVAGNPWGGLILESPHPGMELDEVVISALRGIADNIGSAVTREQLQEKLVHAHKMEAVGMLAGGIAHDFNNLLWPILTYSETLRDRSSSETESAMLNDINIAATRAASLVEQILFMSRRQVAADAPVSLSEVVMEVADIGNAVLGPNIEVSIEIEPDAGNILGDRTAVHRLILNLFTNAREAMENTGGCMRLVVRPATPGERLNADTDTVIFEVHDQGVGMTEEVRNRLFEPYFTTRRGGRGTGLGLTIVHRVASELGGTIEIESEPGRGSTFRVRLPSTGDAPAPATDTSANMESGTETVFLVDDDQSVLNAATQLLESLGYSVIAHNDPEQALVALQDADPLKPGFDLLLTDLTMPVVDGLQLAREAALLHPGMPILLITGFGEEINVKRAPITALLRKPISRSDLSVALQKALKA